MYHKPHLLTNQKVLSKGLVIFFYLNPILFFTACSTPSVFWRGDSKIEKVNDNDQYNADTVRAVYDSTIAKGSSGESIFNSTLSNLPEISLFAEEMNDSIMIYWFSFNEADSTFYSIERLEKGNADHLNWQAVGSVKVASDTILTKYLFYDPIKESGTFYYRVSLKNHLDDELLSETVRINYINSPNEIVVTQNIPNPFSDSTMINFYLPCDTEVEFTFYNSSLKQIHKIPNQLFSGGKNKIYFNAKNISPGIYFYKFEAEEFVEVKKMVVSP